MPTNGTINQSDREPPSPFLGQAIGRSPAIIRYNTDGDEEFNERELSKSNHSKANPRAIIEDLDEYDQDNEINYDKEPIVQQEQNQSSQFSRKSNDYE